MKLVSCMSLVLLSLTACSHSDNGNPNPGVVGNFAVADASGNCTDRFVGKYIRTKKAITASRSDGDDANEARVLAHKNCQQFQSGQFSGECVVNCSIGGENLSSICPRRNGEEINSDMILALCNEIHDGDRRDRDRE